MTATAEVTKSKATQTREDKELVRRVTWRLMGSDGLDTLTPKQVRGIFWAINTLVRGEKDDNLLEKARAELRVIVS